MMLDVRSGRSAPVANGPEANLAMRFRHFVVTRFSIRINDAFKHVSGPVIRAPIDTSNPAWLDARFKVFEMTCLPSVVAQAEQNFAWILLVDRRLAKRDHDRLLALAKRKNETFIHAVDSDSDLASLDWLKSYSVDSADYVVTTNLDSDDVLPIRFVGAIQDQVREASRLAALPPIGFMGAREIVQWELLTSAEAPLGWKAPWHRQARTADGRTVATTPSPGLSLFCKIPAFNFCVLGIRHATSSSYLNFSVPPPNSNAAWFRRSIAGICEANHIDTRTLHREGLHFGVGEDVGPVLMTNHFWNGETQRVFESKAARSIVTGPDDFPEMPIDWEKTHAYAPSFNAASFTRVASARKQ